MHSDSDTGTTPVVSPSTSQQAISDASKASSAPCSKPLSRLLDLNICPWWPVKLSTLARTSNKLTRLVTPFPVYSPIYSPSLIDHLLALRSLLHHRSPLRGHPRAIQRRESHREAQRWLRLRHRSRLALRVSHAELWYPRLAESCQCLASDQHLLRGKYICVIPPYVLGQVEINTQ